MSTQVKDGDAITVVDHVHADVHQCAPLFHAYVLGPTFRHDKRWRSFRWYVPHASQGGWTADDEEGVVWIRGHHTMGAPEALALLAARSLA